MSTEALYYIVFSLLLVAFLVVLHISKNRKYFYYFVVGAIFGFYFDFISFTNGFYSYPSFYKLQILGIPFTMTLAEGFAVAILIFTVEKYFRFWPKK